MGFVQQLPEQLHPALHFFKRDYSNRLGPGRQSPLPPKGTKLHICTSLRPHNGTVPLATQRKHPLTSSQDDAIHDAAFSLRFKYGVHTILLFVDSMQPFSEISATLLAVVRERFPRGLTISHAGPHSTPLPHPDANVRIAYALPASATDMSQGWKDLRVEGDESPLDKGVKDNAAIAFVLLDEDADDAEVEFVVDVPDMDEAYEDEEEE